MVRKWSASQKWAPPPRPLRTEPPVPSTDALHLFPQLRCSVSLDSDSEPRSAGRDTELCSAWVLPLEAGAAQGGQPSSLAQLLARSYSQMLAQALAQNGWAMPDAEEAGALRVLATHLLRPDVQAA